MKKVIFFIFILAMGFLTNCSKIDSGNTLSQEEIVALQVEYSQLYEKIGGFKNLVIDENTISLLSYYRDIKKQLESINALPTSLTKDMGRYYYEVHCAWLHWGMCCPECCITPCTVPVCPVCSGQTILSAVYECGK